MVITKKRIMGLSSLSFIKKGEKVRFGVRDVERYSERLKNIGFTSKLSAGETILPGHIGPVSLRNSEGKFIPDKTKEMETLYRTIEWTMKQWAGRGETRDVTDFVDIPYKRYPRIHIPPQNISLSIEECPSGKLVLTPEIVFSEENEKEIVHMVNLVLEIFKEFEVFNEELIRIKKTKVIRLDWEILPQGKTPWETLEGIIKPLTQRAKKSVQAVVEHRIKFLNNFGPEFKAYGTAGFTGYVVFGYPEKGIFILESYLINNATYIFDHDWDRFSMLTKAQILNNSFQKARVIHSTQADWEERIKAILT